jgi:hypothetical protein
MSSEFKLSDQTSVSLPTAGVLILLAVIKVGEKRVALEENRQSMKVITLMKKSVTG